VSTPDVRFEQIDWEPFSDNDVRPLGRHIRHDEASKAYPYLAARAGKRDRVVHPISIIALDQGDLGSCTGNAGTHDLAATPTHVGPVLALTLDEPFARQLYSDATQIDSETGVWPPTDTGSDGLSVAKVLKARGLVPGYQHTFTGPAALDALQERPLMIGAYWRTAMDHPNADGLITYAGTVRGGHEFLAYAYIPAGGELGRFQAPAGKAIVVFRNSWGTAFGLGGDFAMTEDEFTKMLADDGDVVVLVPSTEPAPTPTPGPAPTPGAAPFPGATPAAAAHLARLAASHGMTATDYLNWRFR
jgi:hypothetical protein